MSSVSTQLDSDRIGLDRFWFCLLGRILDQRFFSFWAELVPRVGVAVVAVVSVDTEQEKEIPFAIRS